MAGPTSTLDELKDMEKKRKICVCLNCSFCYKKVEVGCGQCDFPETDKEKCIGHCYKNK